MRNNLMKRVLTMVFIATICMLSFAGCGKTAEVADTSTTGFEESNEPEEITPDGILEDYMESVGIEYEETLIMDLSERFDGEISICDSSTLSTEVLENRNGRVIVERCYGMVVSRDGDGKVLNPYDKDYDYISYRRCDETREGTLMLTYLVYNPDTNYWDDIIERYDSVVSHELED